MYGVHFTGTFGQVQNFLFLLWVEVACFPTLLCLPLIIDTWRKCLEEMERRREKGKEKKRKDVQKSKGMKRIVTIYTWENWGLGKGKREMANRKSR